MEKEHRRSSILKLKRACNSPPEDDEVVANKSRRVSFANSNIIKPFTHDPDRHTIWDTTYEEAVNRTDSTQASQEQIISSEDKENISVSARRRTIYFNDEDVEMDEDNAGPPIICENQTIIGYKHVERAIVRNLNSENDAGGSDMELTGKFSPSLTSLTYSNHGNSDMELTKQSIDPLLFEAKNVREHLKTSSDCDEVDMELTKLTRDTSKFQSDEDSNMDLTKRLSRDPFMEIKPAQAFSKNASLLLLNTTDSECIKNPDSLAVTVDEFTEEFVMAQACYQSQRPSFSLNINRSDNKTALNLDVSNTTKSFNLNTQGSLRSQTSCILSTPRKYGLSSTPLSPCMDDTQHLINYNLSGTKPSMNYTRILSFNSKVNLETSNFPERVTPVEANDSWLTKVFEKSDSIVNLSDVENVTEVSCTDEAEVEKRLMRKPLPVMKEFVPPKINTDRLNGVTKELFELCYQTEALTRALPDSLKIDFTIKPATYNDSSDSEFECSIVSGPLLSESSTLGEVTVSEKLKQKEERNNMYLKVKFTAPKTCVIEALFGTVILTVVYEEVTGTVLDVGVATEIKADAECITLYSLKLFKEQISLERLSASLGRDFDVLSLVDYVEMIGWENLYLLEEYEKLANYKLEMDRDFKVSFKIIDIGLMSVWRISVALSKPIVTQDCVSIAATVGPNREQAFLNCMEGCPNNFYFFRTFINNIKTYLATLKR